MIPIDVYSIKPVCVHHRNERICKGFLMSRRSGEFGKCICCRLVGVAKGPAANSNPDLYSLLEELDVVHSFHQIVGSSATGLDFEGFRIDGCKSKATRTNKSLIVERINRMLT